MLLLCDGVLNKNNYISVKGKLSLIYSTKVSMENANLHPILTTLCVITFSGPVSEDLFLFVPSHIFPKAQVTSSKMGKCLAI